MKSGKLHYFLSCDMLNLTLGDSVSLGPAFQFADWIMDATKLETGEVCGIRNNKSTFSNMRFDSLHLPLHTTKFKFTIWRMKNPSLFTTYNVRSSVSCKYSSSLYYLSLANRNVLGTRQDSMAQRERIWCLELEQCSTRSMSGKCSSWTIIEMALSRIAWLAMRVSYLVYDSVMMVPCWPVYLMIARSVFGPWQRRGNERVY